MRKQTMHVTAAAKTDTGCVRPHNEDYLWIHSPSGVYVIADGLGGRDAGDVAGRLAARMVGQIIADAVQAHRWSPTVTTIRTIMTAAIETASKRLWSAAQTARQRRHMAATIVVALILPPHAYICHAGDTRAYLARAGQLLSLTDDHSLASQHVALGAVTETASRSHPYRHIVTKVVGQPDPVQPSFRHVLLEPGDWLLLCSDGLWNMLEDAVILRLLQQAGSHPAQAVAALVAAANAAGGMDNVSVVALRTSEERG